ncbi:hypothetical protein P7K49_009253, partial [Saguinus oedipus]
MPTPVASGGGRPCTWSRQACKAELPSTSAARQGPQGAGGAPVLPGKGPGCGRSTSAARQGPRVREAPS